MDRSSIQMGVHNGGFPSYCASSSRGRRYCLTLQLSKLKYCGDIASDAVVILKVQVLIMTVLVVSPLSLRRHKKHRPLDWVFRKADRF